MRLIPLILLGLVFSAGIAFARDPETPFCDGKYALAFEMLDAAYGKYGTVYSGGYERTWRSNGVGPTLDLWRLWRGLPDLRFRDAAQFDYSGDWGQDFSGFGRQAEDMAMLLRIAGRERATGLTEVYRYITAIFLNILVDAGSGPGWWLAPGPRDQTDAQALVAGAVEPGGLMEWLLVVMAASDRPDAVTWAARGDWVTSAHYPWPTEAPRALVRDLVSQRAREEGGLEWQVAALVIDGASGRDENRYLVGMLDCSASVAEYAAGAVEIYESFRRAAAWTDVDLDPALLLPPKMRWNVLANLAIVAVERARDEITADPMRDRLAGIAAMDPAPEFLIWLYAGRAWTAGTVEELIADHDGVRLDQKAVDTLNLLSVADLAAFADAARLPEDQMRMVVTAIATRAFVLGDLRLARRYLKRLGDLAPALAPRLEAMLTGAGPDDVQVARAILALPRPSSRIFAFADEEQAYVDSGTWRLFRDIDLPLRHVSAGVLNRHLRDWLAAPPVPGWYVVQRRANLRGRVDLPEERPFIPEEWQSGAGFPFLRLIAWDELGQMDVCHGLTDRLGEVLVPWVDEASDSWLDRMVMDDAALADILRRVILLNQRSPGALIGEKPAGQAAKFLLETRFPDTAAAKATPYWYFEDIGCRN
jgi:hypothetical protein